MGHRHRPRPPTVAAALNDIVGQRRTGAGRWRVRGHRDRPGVSARGADPAPAAAKEPRRPHRRAGHPWPDSSLPPTAPPPSPPLCLPSNRGACRPGPSTRRSHRNHPGDRLPVPDPRRAGSRTLRCNAPGSPVDGTDPGSVRHSDAPGDLGALGLDRPAGAPSRWRRTKRSLTRNCAIGPRRTRRSRRRTCGTLSPEVPFLNWRDGCMRTPIFPVQGAFLQFDTLLHS